jgi:hypothetical protein
VAAVRADTTALQTTLAQIRPIEICQVRRRPEEKLFEALLRQYHYLGYRRPVGEHLKHLVYACGRPIACLGWSSAPRHLGPRDRFIGWSAEARRQNIRFVAYNTRFLILPWVRVKFLASHLLGRMAAVVDNDWQVLYGHRIYYLETFVDTERFAGTCYRAANWKYLGVTTGRGNNDQTHRVNRSIKAIWGYPLVADFRTRLCGVAQ